MKNLLNELKQARQNKNFARECTIVMTLKMDYDLTVKEINEMLKK